MTRRRFASLRRMALHMWFVMMYIAMVLSSSSMSRNENTTNFWLISTFVAWFMNPDHVPLVYFCSREMSDELPSIPASTISKSERSGGSRLLKSVFPAISFNAYVSMMAWSMMVSSSADNPPSMSLKSPMSSITCERSTSSGFSSSCGAGRSNGFIWCVDDNEILKNLPPVASARYSYSRSGSITITSVPNMSDRRISSLQV